MGITERHWFEDEEPELTDLQLEDLQAVAYLMTVTGKNLNELLGGKK